MKPWLLPILTVATAVAVACAGELTDPARFDIEEEDYYISCFGQQEPPSMFTSKGGPCLTCHTSRDPDGVEQELDLRSPNPGMRLQKPASCPEGRNILDPAAPTESVLYLWVTGAIDEECVDESAAIMPPTGARLSGAALYCLRTWIDGLDGVQHLTENDPNAEGGGGD